MKKTKVITKLIAIILSILVVVQVAPMSTFAETIGSNKFRVKFAKNSKGSLYK